MMNYNVPTLEEMKADLFGYISDGHKDAYGFRPRGYNWQEMSLAELEAWADRIQEAVVESIREDELREAAAIKRFESKVAELIELGAGDRATAIRWLEESEGDDLWSNDSFLWSHGLPYGYDLGVAA